MAEAGVRARIDELRIDASHATASVVQAAKLEERAARLRSSEPAKVDRAIARAVRQLMSDAAGGTLSMRDSLAAVLDINQFKPSRVIWSGPPDTSKILDAFDRLSEAGMPILEPAYPDSRPYTSVASGRIPSVDVSIARGMGGLPSADITFAAHEAFRGADGAPHLRDEETLRTVSFSRLGSVAVGAEAIQTTLDGLEVWHESYTCEHGVRTNEDEVQAMRDGAKLLADATGFVLDVSH